MQTLGNMPFMQIGPFHYIVRLPVPPPPPRPTLAPDDDVAVAVSDPGKVRLGAFAPSLPAIRE